MHFLPLLGALLSVTAGAPLDRPSAPIDLPASGDIGGTVTDSATGTPLAGGEVRILQAGSVIAATVTDAFGRYVVHNLPEAAYRVEVRYLGYRAQTRDLSVGATEGFSRGDFKLTPLPINLSPGELAAARPLALAPRTAHQISKQNDHDRPAQRTNAQPLQQS